MTEKTLKRDNSPRKKAATEPQGGRRNRRGEQQRSIKTRQAILHAALLEFAEHGFDGASTRSIGKRASIHNTLLTYHFKNKDALWRATAEHYFGEIASTLESRPPPEESAKPIDRIRWEFHSFFDFITKNPEFHQFMMQESLQGSERLAWLMDTLHKPIMERVLPEIIAAQAEGDFPEGHPVLVFYFLVGVTTVLSASKAEILRHSGIESLGPNISDDYWQVIRETVFGASFDPAAPAV